MTKREKIWAELEKARKKRAEWDARIKSLEERYREAENTEIHDMVHAANLTPDQLAELLQMFAEDAKTVVRAADAAEFNRNNDENEEDYKDEY